MEINIDEENLILFMIIAGIMGLFLISFGFGYYEGTWGIWQ